MKKLLQLFALILFFTNCSNDDETSNLIIGEWKLIKTEQNDGQNNISITDQTEQNIIYKFQANSNLIITAGSNAGSYKYEYKNDYLSGVPSSEETKIPLVIIDNQKWTYEISNGIMKLSQSYVDGSDLYFKRK